MVTLGTTVVNWQSIPGASLRQRFLLISRPCSNMAFVRLISIVIVIVWLCATMRTRRVPFGYDRLLGIWPEGSFV